MGADTISAVYTGWYLFIAFGVGCLYKKAHYDSKQCFTFGLLWPLALSLTAILDLFTSGE